MWVVNEAESLEKTQVGKYGTNCANLSRIYNLNDLTYKQ